MDHNEQTRGYRAVPFTANRQMVAAVATVGREQNNIHAVVEVDVSTPRRLLQEHHARTGERLSVTAYIITCLAQAVAEHPHLNAFRNGRKLVLLDDVTISCQVERELDGECVPEPVGIRAAQTKSYRQIHDEIRAAQRLSAEQRANGSLGDLSGVTWIRLIPPFLMRRFVRLAARNVRMMQRYGAIGVTAVGMFGQGATWFIPLSGATVAVTVGSIVERPVVEAGQLTTHEHLCLTISFNHDIVDGAPAVRFVKRFAELLASGDLVRAAVDLPLPGYPSRNGREEAFLMPEPPHAVRGASGAIRRRSPQSKMDTESVYEIRVRGNLPERWSDWFEGLAILDGATGETTLRGRLADQAALYGILNRLHALNLPLLAVARIERSPNLAIIFV